MRIWYCCVLCFLLEKYQNNFYLDFFYFWYQHIKIIKKLKKHQGKHIFEKHPKHTFFILLLSHAIYLNTNIYKINQSLTLKKFIRKQIVRIFFTSY